MTVEELRKKISAANEAYWVKSAPTISDTEYDRLVENLRLLSPNDPLLNEIGSTNESGDKVKLRKPMLSLDKRYKWDEIIHWCESVARDVDELFMISPKYDGISLAQQGDTIITRGRKGYYGSDITHLARHICMITRVERDVENEEWITDKMGLAPMLEHSEDDDFMRGELVVPYWRFDKLKVDYPEEFNNYKTPRNLVSGFANSSDESDIANLGNVYIADFIGHRAFEVPVTLRELKEGKRNLKAEVMRFVNDKRFMYPVDGLVVRLADDEYASSLGMTGHHPRGSMAFKFQTEQAEAIIGDVTWQVGEEHVTPVAEFKTPIKLDGVIIKRATLHNPTWMRVNGVHVGARVIIERRGGVIPRVMEVIDPVAASQVNVRMICPACGSPLREEGAFVVCTSKNCSGKIPAKIVSGLEVFGIKGVGPALAQKACREFMFRDIIDWVELFGSDTPKVIELLRAKGFGDNETKVLLRIQSVMKDGTTPTKLLASVRIPKCSTEFVNKVEYNCGGILNLIDITPVDRMYDEIVGKCKIDAVTNFMQWMEDNRERFQNYVKMFNIIKERPISVSKGVVCFTGAGPKPRREMSSIAISKGYQVTENANQCTILVAADPNGSSSKLKKARSSGIKIISYEDFLSI